MCRPVLIKSHMEFLGQVFESDLKRCLDGEEKYNSSWKRRGGHSACENLYRKIDRITDAMEKAGYDVFKAIKGDPKPEGLIDDIRDLRSYLALVEAEMLSQEVVTFELRESLITQGKGIPNTPPKEQGDATAAYVGQCVF